MTSALARWTHEHDRAGVALTIVGEPWEAAAGAMRDSSARLLLPFAFRDAASAEGRALLEAAGSRGRCRSWSGRRTRPGIGRVRQRSPPRSAMQASIGDERVDVAVIGGGPGGTRRRRVRGVRGAERDRHRVDRLGGQASSSPMMRNYLGFPAGVTGAELTARAYPAGDHVRRAASSSAAPRRTSGRRAATAS